MGMKFLTHPYLQWVTGIFKPPSIPASLLLQLLIK